MAPSEICSAQSAYNTGPHCDPAIPQPHTF